MTEEEQHERHVRRETYAPKIPFRKTEARALEEKARDPAIFTLLQHLRRNDSAQIFLTLYSQAQSGQLKKHQTFVDISAVLSEQVSRASSGNKKLKNGIRYPRDYLNFMTIMQSYGQQSAQQYGILSSQLGGPSPRTLQYGIFWRNLFHIDDSLILHQVHS